MRWAALVLALAGCEKLLSLQKVPQPPPDAPPPPPCVMPAISDTFDSGTACSAWGYSISDMFNTQVSLQGGELVISPTPNSHVTNGGCAGSGPVAFSSDSGHFVQVTSLPDGGEYMLFQLFTDPSTVIEISWNVTQIAFDAGSAALGQVLYDPVQTQWVRMRPTPDGTAVIAETAPDARQWTEFGRADITPPTTVRTFLIGGTFKDEQTPKDIKFATFNVCPN